ncbi:MAG: hypothetical protein AAGK23_07305 [Pseudomonadota bacterium]
MARQFAIGLAIGLLVACGGPPEPTEPVQTPPDETLVELPTRREPPALTETADATRSELLALAKAGRLRAFARRADAAPGFVSNFADTGHYQHWLLLRQTGVDPLDKFETLLAEPHAAKDVGGETWFIWPDLAAFAAEDLLPERLGFEDRARLSRLLGEEGVAEIRQGRAYPGFRTAISADGRWVYYLHELGQEEDQE